MLIISFFGYFKVSLISDFNGLGVQIENLETGKHKQGNDVYELLCKPKKCILKKID